MLEPSTDPSRDAPAMILIQATPQLTSDRDQATFEAWGGELPMALYLAAAERLRRHPWPRDAGAVWCLCAENGEVLSSCETYRMTSWMRDSRPGPDGDAGSRPGHSYGIASVYTEPHLRRRGHSTEMLARLAARLTGEDPDAQALLLFSDVALRTYEKAGFAARPGLNLVFGALVGAPRDGGVALLRDDQVAEALARIPRPAAGYLVWPTAEQIDWHLERERIFAELLGRARPCCCGARLGAATALWSADYREGQLTMLLWHAPEPAQAEALLACARRTAALVGLPRTVLWRTPQTAPPVPAVLEDRRGRLDSVPMFRPLDPGLGAGDWDWVPRALWV